MSSCSRDRRGLRRSARERQTVYSNLHERAIGLTRSSIVHESADLSSSQPVSSSENGIHRSLRRTTRRQAYNIDDDFMDYSNDDPSNTPGLCTRTLRARKNRLNEESSSAIVIEEEDSLTNGQDLFERVTNKTKRPAIARDNQRLLLPDTEVEEEEDEEEDEDERDGDVVPRQYALRRHRQPVHRFEEDGDEGDGDGDVVPRQYALRRHRQPVHRFESTLPEPRHSLRSRNTHHHHESMAAFRSPAHKRSSHHRRSSRKRLERRSSSTSSSGSDADEARFERRKQKSMDKGRRRLMPLNIGSEDIRGVVNERRRQGASCSDIDPMAIDRSVTFAQCGGLNDHLNSLKEVVMFPLIYPQLFEKFGLAPPKGVIFYGSPGTGKTLVARALANECSRGDKKVAFFMRKGADCLSKWVGESERQLRLLFDQAYTMRPSIIFFDEIDGLAPVRSSRQDQIHSSIVSTLLALMDGLDSRGEVVVIGATNRLDSIDPALRRPGRFDREMLFTLPDRSARFAILKIHTATWTDSTPSDALLQWIADSTAGYCGADLKALCTESVVLALRKRFPQIYLSSEKLQLDLSKVRVVEQHFQEAMKKIVPSSRRDLSIPSRPLSQTAMKLFDSIVTQIYTGKIPIGFRSAMEKNPRSELECILLNENRGVVPATRLLLSGHTGEMGQTNYVLPALINRLDHLPVFSLGMAHIFAGSSNRSVEEAVADTLQGAYRCAISGSPAVILIPAIDLWTSIVPSSAWQTLVSALESFNSFTSILLLASAHKDYDACPIEVRSLFRRSDTVEIGLPNEKQRRDYLSHIILELSQREPLQIDLSSLEKLDVAPCEPMRRLNESERISLEKHVQKLLRQLRIFLREMLGRLIRDRRFQIFVKPVDSEDAPDYTEVIAQPMDLSTMTEKIDQGFYDSAGAFLADIRLITNNALEYNPNRDPADKMIRHRAVDLRETAEALIDNELDRSFEERLTEMKALLNPRKKEPIEPPAAPMVLHARRMLKFCKDRSRSATRTPSPSLTQKSAHTLSSTERRSLRREHRESAKKQPLPLREHRESAKKRPLPLREHRESAKKRPLPHPKTNHHRSRTAAAAIVKKYKKHNSGGRQASSSATGKSASSEEKSDEDGSDLKMEQEESTGKLPSPEPTRLLINRRRLDDVLEQAMQRTRDWPAGRLERVGAQLCAEIDIFRDNWDRRGLPDRLNQVINNCSLY